MVAESEVKSWLKIILKNENFEDFCVKIVGNSEKGDGYMGDVVFVDVNGTTTNGNSKEYNLVLKCATRSVVLRQKSAIKEAYCNEIFFYNTIFPRFLQFQKEKNVDEPFDKVPKCYGTLIDVEMEILALENLRKRGYILWDRKIPLTRGHVDMVIKAYATFHAVSIAMEREQPQEFQKMTEKLENIPAKFLGSTDMLDVFEATVEEVYNLLKKEMEDDVMLKWRNLKNNVRPILNNIVNQKLSDLNVITHGDCWNNNFMHYHRNNNPVTLAILDWQLVRYTSPIPDLSYFLFSCISEEDINDLDIILQHYHESLVIHLGKLGIANPGGIYSREQFSNEWKKYCQFGIILSSLIRKLCLSEKDEVPDMKATAEKDEDISRVFSQPVKNVADYKKQMSYIIKYVVEHHLI